MIRFDQGVKEPLDHEPAERETFSRLAPLERDAELARHYCHSLLHSIMNLYASSLNESESMEFFSLLEALEQAMPMEQLTERLDSIVAMLQPNVSQEEF